MQDLLQAQLEEALETLSKPEEALAALGDEDNEETEAEATG